LREGEIIRMRIYFTAPAKGKKLHGDNYKKIYDAIEELGHKNLDDLILTIDPKKFYSSNREEQADLYKKTVKHIKTADIVILEVSTSSLSMGFVIAKALDEGKPVIILYLEGVSPYFARGIQDERLQALSYTPERVKQILKGGIEEAKERMNVRFNFFISPKIASYLDWIAKNRKLPRAVFLRRLIGKHMKKNREYKG